MTTEKRLIKLEELFADIEILYQKHYAVTGTAQGGLTMAKPKIYGSNKPLPIKKTKGKKAPWQK